MKQVRLFSLAIITILIALPSVGQVIEDGEAFYIYRNDGNFDGFFYDQVQEMRYSNIDMEGIEHDVYVVQEVVTNDSVYRIPLTAIDSIGFVQPEVIFNPELKTFEESNLVGYIEDCYYDNGEGEWQVMLARNTPTRLLPKVGDKLMSLTNSIVDSDINNSRIIAGTVTKITNGIYDDGRHRVYIKCFDDVSDVFRQFICVEQVTLDGQGNSKRRMSGLKEALRASGSHEGNLIDFSAALKKVLKFGEKGEVEVSASLGLTVGVMVAYNITLKKFFIKTSLREGVELNLGLEVTLAGGQFQETWDVLPVPVGEVLFPACFPIFAIDVMPKLFVRGEAKAAASISFPAFSYQTSQTIILDSEADDFLTTSWDESDCPDDGNSSWLDDVDLSFSFSGFLQAGVKQELGIKTNSLVKKLCSGNIGVNLYAGPKIQANLSLSVTDLFKDANYFALKNTYIKVSRYTVDAEGEACFKYLWKDPNREKFFDVSLDYGSLQLYLLPVFDDVHLKMRNPEAGYAQYGFTASHNLIFPSNVGVQVDDGFGNRITNYIHPRKLSIFNAEEAVDQNIYIGNKAGRYTFTPFVDILGERMLAEQQKRTIDVEPYLRLNINKTLIGPKDTTIVATYATNINFDLKTSTIDFSEQYLNGLVKISEINKQAKTITFKIKRNDTFEPRAIDIVLVASTAVEEDYILACTSKNTIIQDADFSAIKYVKVSETLPFVKHNLGNNVNCSFFYPCSNTIDDASTELDYATNYRWPCTATLDANKRLHVVVDESWEESHYDNVGKKYGTMSAELVYDLSALYSINASGPRYARVIKITLHRDAHNSYDGTDIYGDPYYYNGSRNSDLVIQPKSNTDIIIGSPYSISGYGSGGLKYEHMTGTGSLSYFNRSSSGEYGFDGTFEIDSSSNTKPSLIIRFYRSVDEDLH